MTTGLKSIALASTHKAGSSVLENIFRIWCSDIGYDTDLIEVAGWGRDGSLTAQCIAAQPRMRETGMFCGMFRGPYVGQMPKLNDLRLVIQVRDPRDCITSYYYSLAFSHGLPKPPRRRAEFQAIRDAVRQMTIDEFALNHSRFRPSYMTGFAERLRILQRLVETHPDHLLLRYETMVSDPATWFEQIEDFLGHSPSRDAQRNIARIADFTAGTEDPGKHRRQVQPGDHLRKLQPATIARLNEDLAEGLAFFGYD